MSKKIWCLQAIKKINTEARNRCNRHLKKFNITDAQLDVLFFLFESGEAKITQRDIENELHLSNPTIVSIIDRLEKKGFVRRVSSDKDHRCKYIEVTEQCAEIRNDVYDGLIQNEECLLDGLSADERDQLRNLLCKMLHNIGGG